MTGQLMNNLQCNEATKALLDFPTWPTVELSDVPISKNTCRIDCRNLNFSIIVWLIRRRICKGQFDFDLAW